MKRKGGEMIRVYNTSKGKVEEFIPIEPGKISMYVCGPTVYNYIHIGNARPAMFFDTVRRYFEYRGYEVKYVQNFTDVDDKMITKAKEEGITLKEVADKYIQAYFEDTGKLNLKEEGMIRPKATENIPEMIELISILIEKKYAYEINGDVYFNVENYKANYGELSRQKIDELRSGIRIDVNETKLSPLDFALWKEAKEGEPSWTSPWGEGRPGWHIECSAMSNKYLGATFDIHGGGQDLIFPHHENEIAQSKCSTGGDFARYWIHNGYINLKGEKMSKSKGNFFLLREVLKKYQGNVVRFFILGSHYRKPIDFSEEELKQSAVGLERISNTVTRAKKQLVNNEKMEEGKNSGLELKVELEKARAKFIEFMDEDFNTSGGVAAIFDFIKEINKTLDEEKLSKDGIEVLRHGIEFIEDTITGVLGVKLETEEKMMGKSEELLEFILELRREARKNENWAFSDRVRDGLSELGIKIKDGKDSTEWSI